jgi:FtsP/CotA-like multicopper oxidase with cupredoxin domain
MVRASGGGAYPAQRAGGPVVRRRTGATFRVGARLHPPGSGSAMTTDHDLFPTDTTGLAPVSRPAVIGLADGARLALSIGPVRKDVSAADLGDAGPGAQLRMLAYNGSIPGPTLRVAEGSAITVDVRNDGDVETTVHWHGLRLENRYDGVPHETQTPIPVGGGYRCHVQFPDAGFYWYHPHLREDFGQEMGLYGTIVVEPSDRAFWPPVDRELTLTLDDLLVEEGHIAAFHRSGPNFTAMGRFGNLLLINGEPTFAGPAAVGEVLRLYLVSTANTRLFDVALPGARMKLVGGDSGRYERETFVDDVLLAPSERAVVDVLFDAPGEVRLQHRTPDRVYDLGAFTVSAETDGTGAAHSYGVLRTDPELTAERRRIQHDLTRDPDKVLAFLSKMSMADMPMDDMPMDGMPTADMPTDHGDGLEWEDLMPEMNRASDPSNMIWQLVDRETGAANSAIDWAFTVGDRVKIRLVNEPEQDHPMHHPFHIHGAGRFLVLARDGEPEANLVWKDTVLLGAGRTIDILLDVSNPGLWMAHCHIAEHTESGMMFSFTVARTPAAVR